MKKAIVFFADGTEECEALLAVDLLRRAKAQVTIVAVCPSDPTATQVTSSHGVPIVADCSLQQLDASDADLIVLPGGMPGTTHLAQNETVLAAVQAQMQAGKLIAAICAAPSILGALGLLNGRNATAHFAFQDKLTGATVLDQEVVVDGNIITSYGLGGAIPFALALVRALFDDATAKTIQDAIAYRH